MDVCCASCAFHAIFPLSPLHPPSWYHGAMYHCCSSAQRIEPTTPTKKASGAWHGPRGTTSCPVAWTSAREYGEWTIFGCLSLCPFISLSVSFCQPPCVSFSPSLSLSPYLGVCLSHSISPRLSRSFSPSGFAFCLSLSCVCALCLDLFRS